MAIFKVYLSKKFSFEQGFGEGDLYVAALFIMDFFKEVIKGSKTFTGCDYFTEPNAAMVGSQDVLCYLLANSTRSIASRNSAPALGGTGTTWCPQGKVISEIYMDVVIGQADVSRLLANIIIHELMHNKLDADPNQTVQEVHKILGGQVSRDKQLSAADVPSQQDVEAMRKGIGLAIAQHTGGL
jgi:hypothetical protein